MVLAYFVVLFFILVLGLSHLHYLIFLFLLIFLHELLKDVLLLLAYLLGCFFLLGQLDGFTAWSAEVMVGVCVLDG